jgi:hypothetical protein
MKTISPKDASLLALLAEKSGVSSATRRRLLGELEPEALNIAIQMGRGDSEEDSKAATTARGLEKWAETNKRPRRGRSRPRRSRHS